MKKTRRLRSLLVFLTAAVILIGLGFGLRLLILRQIRASLGPSLNYARIRLTVIPPSVVIEDVRSVTSSPFFTADRITVRFSYGTLLRRDKSLRVLIEQPVLRVYESSPAGAKGTLKQNISLPFTIENGIVRGAEIHYYGQGASLSARNVRAVFRGKKDAFVLRVESPENTVMLDVLRSPLEGKVTAWLEGKGPNLTFRKLNAEGSGFFIKARGVLSDLDDPQYEFQAGLAAPADLIAALFKLPFQWSGNARGEGRLVRKGRPAVFQADLASSDLAIHSIPLGRVEGTVAAGGNGGRVDLTLQKGLDPRASVEITFGGGRVEGVVTGVHLDPIIREIKIPWPVKSPAWGGFSLEAKRLQARAEFRDEQMIPEPGRFPFKGLVDLTWDGKTIVRFTSEKMESTFGTFGVEGDLDIGRTISILIKGDVSDVQQGREFTSLVLRQTFPIPEIRGRGRADIKILGDFRAPQVKADFALAPGGYGQFNAAAVSGTFELAKKEISGLFKIQDPDMRGDLRLFSRPGDLDIRIRADEASLEKVLPNVNIKIPLAGRSAGDIAITRKNDGLLVTGSFSASRLKLLGQDLSDVSGRLEWRDAEGALSFPEIQAGLYGGRIKGSARVGFKDRRFDLDLQAADLDLTSLYSGIQGRAAFDLKGRGDLDKDAAVGKFSLKDVHFASFEPLDASGDVELSYADNRLGLKLSGALDPGRNDFSLSLSFPPPDRSLLINIKGRLLNPDLILPWKGVQGEVSYLAEIKSAAAGLEVSGVVDFKGPLLPFPGIAQALTDYSGLVFIQNNRATLRSFQGRLGGGSVSGSGEIRFGNRGIELLDIQAEGKEVVLALLERTRALADGSLRLFKDDTRFSLTGDFLIKNLSWKRELSEKFIFSSSSYLEPKKEKGLFDDLALNIRLRADDNAVLENSMGRVQGRFDLTISGKAGAPVLLGDIEGLRGNVNFQDRSFRVLKARLSFFNPASVEPYIDFQGETFLKDYRVTFTLTGLVNRLRPEFASSPPLPPEDVLALLALGESFKRTYSYDTSSRLGTGSMLSFQLGEEAQKRAERLFSLDRFRIDPFVLGASSEMTARLTVGKKISRNIILLYSTNLTSQREEIVRLEWEFSESFSLVGMRDERGRISFDAKIRKRF
ncbi:MAG: translocation/assembly module TamB domain-containing protein [Candidatus Aminicenantes bacterium]|nr:translocation/assembly module TamB domain-containing protein [Candidatus Aminicenantes bacterium]